MKKLVFLNLFIVLTIVSNLGCKRTNTSYSLIKESSINKSITKDSLDKVFLGPSIAKEEFEKFINDSTKNLLKGKILIKDKQDLVLIAEPILFNIYGKECIIKERPYEIYLFGDYWIMMGTLTKNTKGGTFTIVINRKTCEIIGISHGK